MRQHAEWESVGTPLTHVRFRRRHEGAYSGSSASGGGGGPGQAKGVPTAVMAAPGVWCVGDNVFPGVGTPAAAANGMWVANTIAPWWRHWAAANTLD